MVAGQEHDRALPFPALELAQHAAPPFLGRAGLIEQVAGAEHGVDVVALGEIEDTANGIEAGSRQAQLLVMLKGGKAPAQVPVGGVQKRQRQVVLLGHAITNSAVNSRVTLGAV